MNVITEVPNAGLVYKLGTGTSAVEALGLMLADASPTINRGKMSARVRISRETPDRSKDTVRAKGAQLDNHKRNPVVCVSHNRNVIAGMAEDPLKHYTLKMCPDGLGWDAETFFSQSTKVGEQAFRLVESGVFRGASIGFLPVVGQIEKSHHGGTDYREWELVEYSHLPIPDHPDCLVLAVEKGFGGKPLVPELLDILKPLVPIRPASVVGGWESKTATFKTAAAKEVEPQYRSAVYYTCPHCECEMPPESIYREEDGTTRHGPCRGAVVLKPATTMGMGPAAEGVHPGPAKTLGEHITNRIRHLRSKGMATYPPPDEDVDEFAPVDADADPNADPNLSADPHADHKAVVDDAVGNVLASIYDKFTSGAIEMKEAVKLFKSCLTHHGDVASLDAGNGLDDPDDMDEDDESDDPDGTDDFGDSFEDDEDDSDSDSAPDLEDKKKKKAEKACHEIWNTGYVPGLESIANGLVHIVKAQDPDARKVQKYARTLLGKMAKLPAIDGMVTKALAEESAWSEWEGAFFNGRH